MLIQLTPDQCVNYWNDIKASMYAALPPMVRPTEEGMQSILEHLMNGEMQAWILYELVENKTVIYALGVTVIQTEFGTEQKNLLIYSLYGYQFTNLALWQGGLNGLKQFARSKGCVGILAYTKVPRIIEIVNSLGGSAEFHIVSLEV